MTETLPQQKARPIPAISDIKDIVAMARKVSVSDLTGPSRLRPIAHARQEAMALARELRRDSLPMIGREFGGRDHTTVMHGLRAVSKRRNQSLEHDEAFRAMRASLSDLSEARRVIIANTRGTIKGRIHMGLSRSLTVLWT